MSQPEIKPGQFWQDSRPGDSVCFREVARIHGNHVYYRFFFGTDRENARNGDCLLDRFRTIGTLYAANLEEFYKIHRAGKEIRAFGILSLMFSGWTKEEILSLLNEDNGFDQLSAETKETIADVTFQILN